MKRPKANALSFAIERASQDGWRLRSALLPALVVANAAQRAGEPDAADVEAVVLATHLAMNGGSGIADLARLARKLMALDPPDETNAARRVLSLLEAYARGQGARATTRAWATPALSTAVSALWPLYGHAQPHCIDEVVADAVHLYVERARRGESTLTSTLAETALNATLQAFGVSAERRRDVRAKARKEPTRPKKRNRQGM